MKYFALNRIIVRHEPWAFISVTENLLLLLNLQLKLFLAFLSHIRLCFRPFMLSFCPDVTVFLTQKPLLAISHTAFIASSSSCSIWGFKLHVTLCWPLAGQNRKRKQTGISEGSSLPICFIKASVGMKISINSLIFVCAGETKKHFSLVLTSSFLKY